MKKKITVFFIIGLIIATITVFLTAKFYVCGQVKFILVNMTRQDIEAELKTYEDIFLWRGQLAAMGRPLVIKASVSRGNTSYALNVYNEKGHKILNEDIGYDNYYSRNIHLLAITNKEIFYTFWSEAWNDTLSSLWYLAKTVIGDAISCRMQRLGLSPATIPPSLLPR